MEIILTRKFDLFTCFFKYQISINEKVFSIGKSGDYPILVDETNHYKISAIASNYYYSIIEFDNLKAKNKIIIVPAYNKMIMILLFAFSLIGLVYSITIESNILRWVPIIIFLGYHLYYFHVRRKSFFRIFVQK